LSGPRDVDGLVRPVPHAPVAARPGPARRGPPAGRPRLPTATPPVLGPLGDPRRAGHHVPTTPRRHRVATTPQLHRGRPADGRRLMPARRSPHPATKGNPCF